jgi:Protein of unknown function (DUF3577)
MTNATNSTTSVLTANAQDNGYVNALQRGWAYVRRVRTVMPTAKSKSKTPTLHAYIAFLGGDGVDCKISGEDAKKLFLNHDLESLSKAGNTEIAVQCTVGDVYSDIYKDGKGEDKAARKGRLLKISQLLINGESRFDDGGAVFEQTTLQASGYLRSVRRYNKDGVPTTAVTIQFVHGKKGELNSDSHSLTVTDPALIDLITVFEAKAQALNSSYDKTVEGSKKYLHSVWVAANAVDCSSNLYIGKDKKTYVGRQGTLKSISCIMVDGEVMYSAKLEQESQAAAQATAQSEGQTEGETAQAAAPEAETNTLAQAPAQAVVDAEDEANIHRLQAAKVTDKMTEEAEF